MAQIGWIKLYRKIWDCDIWKDAEPFNKRSAWIDMLLMANYEEKVVVMGMKRIKVGRGSFITSQDHLAERWHWGRHKVRNFLNLLVECNMVELKTANKYTHVTIVNYGIYNDLDSANGPTKEQQKANNGPSEGQQRATTKEYKECEEDKEKSTDVVVVPKDISKGSSYSVLDEVTNAFGYFPSPYQVEKFIALYEEVGEGAFAKALDKAANANARNYNYLASVARSIAAGDDYDNKPKANPGLLDFDAALKAVQANMKEKQNA